MADGPCKIFADLEAAIGGEIAAEMRRVGTLAEMAQARLDAKATKQIFEVDSTEFNPPVPRSLPMPPTRE